MHNTKITKLYSFEGLKRVDEKVARPGDILAVAGVEGITIGETITSAETPSPMPRIQIDEPTIGMTFTINSSPFAGRGSIPCGCWPSRWSYLFRWLTFGCRHSIGRALRRQSRTRQLFAP